MPPARARLLPTIAKLGAMHDAHRRGGQRRQAAAQVVYSDAVCPHAGCDQQAQAIDFRLEDYERSVHDPLVRAWWDDTGFTGQCPNCGGWIHFTIRGKRATAEDQAKQLPQLSGDWYASATVL